MKDMKGWLLFGGDDSEWELQEFMKEVEQSDVTISKFDPGNIDIVLGTNASKSIFADESWQVLPDFVYPAFGGNPSYQSKAVLRHLASLNVFCINEWESIEAASDKLYSLQLLARNSIPVPSTILVRFPPHEKLYDFIKSEFEYPVVLKTLSGSKGIGVFFADDKEQLRQLLELIDCTDPSTYILVQKFIDSSSGRDLRVFTLGGEAIACIQRKSSSKGERRANVSQGGSPTPYGMSDKIKTLAEKISELFELKIAGVDLLFGENDDEFVVCEVNSCPGFKGIHQADSNINIPKKILEYVKGKLP